MLLLMAGSLVSALGQSRLKKPKVTLQHQAGPGFRLFQKDKTDSLFRPAPLAFFLEEKIIIHYPSFGLSFTAGMINHVKEKGIEDSPGQLRIRSGGGIKANYFMLGLEGCRAYEDKHLNFMLKYYGRLGIAILEARELSIKEEDGRPVYQTFLEKNTSFTASAGLGIHTHVNPRVLIGLNFDLMYFRARAFVQQGIRTPVLSTGSSFNDRFYLKPGLVFSFKF